MRRKHGNEFTNGGFNEFKKQTGNILNHVETLATFDALDNVSSGYGPGCDAPSVGAPLASCYSRIIGLYLNVFRKCSEFCGVKSQRECSTTFRGRSVIFGRVLQVFSGIWQGSMCAAGHGFESSPAFVGGVRDGLDKRKLQTSGDSDVFEAYLALCSSGAGSRRSRSLSQTTPVSNSNLVHTDFSSVCGPSASLPGRSFHAYPNVVMITGVNNNGSSASRRDRNLQVRPRLNSAVGVRSTSRRTHLRVLTSGSIVDSNSVASAELVEKYKPADPTKIPPEILAAQGKHGVFQFHFNTLGNLTDLSLDVVYDVKKQDHSTQEINKGTPSSASAATNQPTEEEENTQKDKQKDTAGEGVIAPKAKVQPQSAAKNKKNSDRDNEGSSAMRPF
ncbi:hypothetical protein Tco_0232119 [Tanacetum coccineum]